MRKVTKNKHRKAKTGTRGKIYIKHNKGRGKEELTYEEAVNKIQEIFGKKTLENAIKYGNSDYIQKLIDLIKEEKRKYDTNISNSEQISLILHPALENLLNHIKDTYYIKVFGAKSYPLKLIIPRLVNIDSVLKPERIEKILAIADENNLTGDQLIQEFILNLEVLKLGPNSSITITVPDLPSLPPPPPPRQSSYKSPRRSKSSRSSKSPYTPRRSKSPVSIVVTPVSRRNPDAIRVRNVLILGRGKNYKKTRRHK